ncbi:hypothetical protein ANO14919_106210 [Xylariales sp. No.14919]|nr:hypothetical protein ANO14919_106210 [Xylariales sp. No.14919]
MFLIRPLRLARLNLATRYTVPPRTTLTRPFIRVNVQPLRSLRFKTTSATTASPGPAPKPLLPARFCLYHAGTIRVTFLACLKLSTLFLFVFFGFVVTPAYYEKEGLSPTVARTALCAIAPLIFVAYTTAPFVAFVHIRPPPFARQSKEMLERYLRTLSPQNGVEITTMSLIAKPRMNKVKLSELAPVHRRFGIVNLARDTTAENATRKWYMFRAVSNFNVLRNNTSPNDWGWHIVYNNIIAKQR